MTGCAWVVKVLGNQSARRTCLVEFVVITCHYGVSRDERKDRLCQLRQYPSGLHVLQRRLDERGTTSRFSGVVFTWQRLGKLWPGRQCASFGPGERALARVRQRSILALWWGCGEDLKDWLVVAPAVKSLLPVCSSSSPW
jgi:hypothetical protein